MFAIRIFPLRNLVFYLQAVVAAAQTDEGGGELLSSWDLPLLYVIVHRKGKKADLDLRWPFLYLVWVFQCPGSM